MPEEALPEEALPEEALLYCATRDSFIELLLGLDGEQLATQVPLSPAWSVQDVAAHVCGINADVLSQRLEGFGTDAWTNFQVKSRRDNTLQEVCDEWISHTQGITARIVDDPFFGIRLTGDLIIHIQDVQHALDLPIDQHDRAVLAGAARYVPHLQERVLERLGVGIGVELTEGGAFPAPAEATGPELSLRVSDYDFLRAVSGRRSRRQVEAFAWQGDPSEMLDKAWAAYGDLRREDVSA